VGKASRGRERKKVITMTNTLKPGNGATLKEDGGKGHSLSECAGNIQGGSRDQIGKRGEGGNWIP